MKYFEIQNSGLDMNIGLHIYKRWHVHTQKKIDSYNLTVQGKCKIG